MVQTLKKNRLVLVDQPAFVIKDLRLEAASAAALSTTATAVATSATASSETTAAATTIAAAVASAASVTATATSATTAASVAAATATAVGASAAASTALTARPRLVDGETSSVHFGIVLVGDRRIELIGIDVYERKTAAFDDARVLAAVAGEMLEDFVLSHRIGDIPYVESLNCHSLPCPRFNHEPHT